MGRRVTRSRRLRFVDAVRIEERFFLWREIVPLIIELDVEAACEAGVAGATMLFDFKEEGVAIAIHEPAEDLLRVAARFAFFPELLAGAAPVVHVAGLNGVFERVFVHPRHHEHAAAGLGALLHDGRNEPAVVIFEIQLHRVISEVMSILRKKIIECRSQIVDSPLRSGARFGRIMRWTPSPLMNLATAT